MPDKPTFAFLNKLFSVINSTLFSVINSTVFRLQYLFVRFVASAHPIHTSIARLIPPFTHALFVSRLSIPLSELLMCQKYFAK